MVQWVNEATQAQQSLYKKPNQNIFTYARSSSIKAY